MSKYNEDVTNLRYQLLKIKSELSIAEFMIKTNEDVEFNKSYKEALTKLQAKIESVLDESFIEERKLEYDFVKGIK